MAKKNRNDRGVAAEGGPPNRPYFGSIREQISLPSLEAQLEGRQSLLSRPRDFCANMRSEGRL